MKKIISFLVLCAILTCGVTGLSACAHKAEYTVVCQSCENGYVIVADTKAEAGKKVILAAKPDIGYKLAAFIVDGEEIDGVSFVMPDKNVTVSAQFEAVTYSVTYILGDATVVGNNPATYTVENAAQLISPQKEGYEICGWYRYHTEPEENYGWDIEAYRVTSLKGLYGNLTLYAEYYNPLHNIQTDATYGSCYIEDYVYQAYYGETLTVVVDPLYGYELDCITVNGELIEGLTFTMPADDVEIVAECKPIRYAITYELDGGVNAPDNAEYYTVEDGYVRFYDAEKEGYIFYGWYYDEEHTNPVGDGVDAYTCHPLTLYAWFVADDEIDNWIEA